MKGIGKKIVSIAIMAAVGTGLVIGNNLCMQWEDIITAKLCGTGDNFENATETLAASDELCQKIEEESIVLLKNQDNALPLGEQVNKINLFGYGATDNGFLLRGVGSGSSTISENKKVTLTQALKDAGFEINQDVLGVYNSWVSSASVRPASAGSGNAYNLAEPAVSSFDGIIDDAKTFSDVAMFVISRDGGENCGEIPLNQTSGNNSGTNKTYLEITDQEQETLDYLKAHFGKVIVLLNTTNNVHTGFLTDDGIDAALYVGLTGQSGTRAIANILRGYKIDEETNEKVTVTPSGKLADTYTYAYSNGYDPAMVNRSYYYNEDIYFGYKWYETAAVEGYFDNVDNEYGTGYDGVVQYPFGFGLSYTSFEWSVVDEVVNPTLDAESEITITVDVTNTGEVAGKDVVELYYTPPYTPGGIEKAEVNLLDFVKTPTLEPGQTARVTLSFTSYDMASYDAYDKNKNGFAGYELESGKYTVSLRTDAHTVDDSEGATIEYTVANDIRFETDPTTGNKVENRLTGDTAYAGVSIDGSNVGLNSSDYMSRADFAGTYPKSVSVNSNNSSITAAKNYMNTTYDDAQMPTTGADNGLSLTMLEDGSLPTSRQLSGYDLTENNSLVYNDELIKQLAANYDSDLWEDLLDQMTTTELKNLVELGGFGRIVLESVGMPVQTDYDGPAGFNTTSLTGNFGGGTIDKESWTAFPSEALMACSWNKTLMFELGRSMGAEADVTHVNGWYAPGVNLHRSAYIARNYEYYSEDGFLSGQLAAMVIYGAKTNGLSAYLKHFVCHEFGPNDKGSVWLTEQNLRENYLKPFEIAVKVGKSNGIMTAFNRVGAVWAGANYALLTEVLRDEWGFKGTVITDWTAGKDSVGGMNVNQGVRAGGDLWLCPNSTPWTGSNSLSTSDAVEMYCARQAAHNILYMAVDTRTTYLNYDPSEDDIYGVSGQIGFKDDVFAWWKPVLYGVDGLVALLFVIWFIKLFKKSPAEKIAAIETAPEVEPDIETPDIETAVEPEISDIDDELEQMRIIGARLRAMEEERIAKEKEEKERKKRK